MEVFLFFRVTRIRNWRRLHRKAEIMNLISQPKRQRADLTSRSSTLHGSSSDFYRLFFIFKSFHFILPRLSHSPYRTVYFSPVSSLARCLNRVCSVIPRVIFFSQILFSLQMPLSVSSKWSIDSRVHLQTTIHLVMPLLKFILILC